MRLSFSLFVASAALMLATTTHAQRRIKGATVYIPQAQVEIPLSGNDYVFGAFNLLHSTVGLEAEPLFNGQGIRLGYEHFFNEQWSWGATLDGLRQKQVSFFNERNIDHYLLPEVFGRHWNTFGQANFRQRLAVGYSWPLDVTGGGRFLTSLRLDVDRVFPLGSSGLALRPRIAFEPVAYLRFQREDYEVKEPFLDFSELRGEVGMRLSPRFDFTPWFAWQNTYRTTLSQYDINGNIVIEGGTVRFVQPTVGLDLRLTLGSPAGTAERRQLPTQY